MSDDYLERLDKVCNRHFMNEVIYACGINILLYYGSDYYRETVNKEYPFISRYLAFMGEVTRKKKEQENR